MWRVVELAVFSKAERFGKAPKPRTGFVAPVVSLESIEEGEALELSSPDSSAHTDFFARRKKRKKDGWKVTHDLELLEHFGRRDWLTI